MSRREQKEELINNVPDNNYVRQNLPIDLLVETHSNNLIHDTEGQASAKKDAIVEFLSTWRTKEFREFPDLERELKEGILQRHNKSNLVAKATRETLMESEFFSLQSHSRANE